MHTARKAPRACSSCRSQLQSLFEQGFTTLTPLRPLLRHRQLALYPRSLQIPIQNHRSFSTSRIRLQHEPTAVETAGDGQSIEDVVRNARQTFGETLPK